MSDLAALAAAVSCSWKALEQVLRLNPSSVGGAAAHNRIIDNLSAKALVLSAEVSSLLVSSRQN